APRGRRAHHRRGPEPRGRRAEPLLLLAVLPEGVRAVLRQGAGRLTPELTCLGVAQVFRPARGVANRAKALFHFTSTQLNHGVGGGRQGRSPPLTAFPPPASESTRSRPTV